MTTGCQTTKSIIGPYGTEHIEVTCADKALCYTRARETCGGNYKIVDAYTDVSGFHGETTTTQQILVKCLGLVAQ